MSAHHPITGEALSERDIAVLDCIRRGDAAYPFFRRDVARLRPLGLVEPAPVISGWRTEGTRYFLTDTGTTILEAHTHG